jgi:hypothetical protein
MAASQGLNLQQPALPGVAGYLGEALTVTVTASGKSSNAMQQQQQQLMFVHCAVICLTGTAAVLDELILDVGNVCGTLGGLPSRVSHHNLVFLCLIHVWLGLMLVLYVGDQMVTSGSVDATMSGLSCSSSVHAQRSGGGPALLSTSQQAIIHHLPIIHHSSSNSHNLFGLSLVVTSSPLHLIVTSIPVASVYTSSPVLIIFVHDNNVPWCVKVKQFDLHFLPDVWQSCFCAACHAACACILMYAIMSCSHSCLVCTWAAVVAALSAWLSMCTQMCSENVHDGVTPHSVCCYIYIRCMVA